MKNTLLLFSLLVSMYCSYSQKEISGVTPEKSVTVDGKSLAFNGAGLREKFFLDLYVGSLYLTNKTNDPKKVINSDEYMAITLDIVSGLITSEKMITAIDEGFEKSTKGNLSPIASKIAQFKDAFSEKIVKGNDFMISYTPEKGTSIYKNGKFIKTIDGLEFKKAVFGIWFCDEPADEDLMEDMLGK